MLLQKRNFSNPLPGAATKLILTREMIKRTVIGTFYCLHQVKREISNFVII